MVVLGNEACDLDSAVSAISLAFFLNFMRKYKPKQVIPVFNIPREELPLKTEVTYFLQKKSIDLENLICKDEIKLNELQNQKKLNVILVDHHFSNFSKEVVQVFDHRPYDPNSNLPENCEKRIELVGSCASLIADHILLNELNFTEKSETLELLYAAIILDTVNFSKDADKARPLDVDVTQKIEEVLQIEKAEVKRSELLNDLVVARSDVSSLNSLQILYKDLKIIKNKCGSKTIALPGFPISVMDFIEKEDAEINLKQFSEKHKCDIVLLIGLKIVDGFVQRDLGLINFKDEILFEKVKNFH